MTSQLNIKKGVENKLADALSRRGENEEFLSLYAISFPNPSWLQELKKAYETDELIK